MNHIEQNLATNTVLQSLIDLDGVALSSGLPVANTSSNALNISVEGNSPSYDLGEEAHVLEAENSSLIEESAQPGPSPSSVTDANSSPSDDASLPGPSGVPISSHLPEQHEVATTQMFPQLTTTEQYGDHEDDGYDHPEEVDSPDTLQTLPASGSSVRGEDTPGISTLQDILLSMGTVDAMFVNGRLVININLGVANNTNASNRAATLIKCMEVIPDELVLRYNKLRSSDGEGMEECPVCHDALVSVPKAPGDEDTVDASPHPIVAFPCAGKHLFHTQCLLPWLEQNTTCPSCRFNIDPDRKLRQYPFGSWQPPQVESMCDWLAAKEQAKEAEFAECDLAMSECPAPSPATPPSLGSEVDTNTSLDRDASPLVGDSETNGTSPSGSAPRTSESYLTVRVADDDIGIGL